MSADDPRWVVLAGLRNAIVEDLAFAVRLWDGRGPAAPGGRRDDATRTLEKALQKALRGGYSTFGRASEYVLSLAGETRPTGGQWHARLLTMVLSPSRSRPALVPGSAGDLRELRLFRHVAMHGDLEFDLDRAAPTAQAARRLVATLPGAFDAFGRDFGLLAPPEPPPS